MNTPVVDFVRRYAQQRTTRMHMPGHKGRGPLGCEELDITEIAGADELYEAEGIIAQSEANATQLFGTARTYYSTEGSSQCIRAMLRLALQMRPAKAGRPVLLAARNAHKALLYAAALLDFDIQWLWPAPDAAGALCTCPVEPEALASALDELSAEGRTPFGVYLTSPDYLGFVQDVAGLSAVCHAHGLPLLVDNAHGAYLHFLKEGSRHPIQLGADLCCDSAHKTLPVLTGGAYLHLGPSVQADEAAVRNALALFGSTSPSYLILQSLDAANAVLADSFREKLDICRWRLGMLCRELDALRPGLVLPLTGAHREPLKLTLDAAALGDILRQVLYEFPVRELDLALPRWVNRLENGHWLQAQVYTAAMQLAENIARMKDVPSGTDGPLLDCDAVQRSAVSGMDLAQGSVRVVVELKPEIFYQVLSEQTGLEIGDEAGLMPCILELAHAKREYEKVRSALEQVEATGYGIVMPSIGELQLEQPEIVQQGGRYGVRLEACAPSIHMMKATIHTEISPIVGTEKQSEDLVRSLLADFADDPVKLWQSNIFGKSLHELVNDGLQNKLLHIPQEARTQLQGTLERVINEGCTGLICILI